MTIKFKNILFLAFFLFSFLGAIVPVSAAEGPFYIYESSDGLGGQCQKIGDWENSSKTCKMKRDVFGTVIISGDNAILDGNGHKIIGENKAGNGILMEGLGTSVKNVSVSNFLRGIYLLKNGSVSSSEAKDNYYGIYAYGSDENRVSAKLSNNSISSSFHYGISLFYTRNNEISGNSVGPANRVGVFEALSDHSLFEGNDFFENSSGAVIMGDYNILRQNKIRQSGEKSLYIESEDMLANEISLDNTIDGHPIYYEKNVSGKTYDESLDMGGFYCSNCQNIILKNITFPEKQAPVIFWKTNDSLISGLSSQDKSLSIEFFRSSRNTVKENSVWEVKLNTASNQNKIYRNNIFTNDKYMVSTAALGNVFYENPPAGGNYWEMNKGACKDLNADGFCDSSFLFLYSIDRYPLAKEIDFSGHSDSGNSSVLFLPGIKASKLYKEGMVMEDQLWPPNYFGDDAAELALTHEGTSIKDVYTREIIRELPVTGKNIYESFAGDLEKLKENGDINDFQLFAYDWRQSVSDIAQNGTPYEDGTKSAIAELEKLAENSKSKKVAIVAHSNGGLLAKAIMLKLKELGKENLVDKIVLVGTPQMGTPKAVLSLLYGYDESLAFGTLLSREEARKLGENMPGAYGLLPGREYVHRLEEPLIDFSAISVSPERTRYKSFRDAYGENIGRDEFDQFQNFLTGALDGREKPETQEIEKENTLRKNLLDGANAMRENLDNWDWPENLKVIQIAGWGLDTVSGVEYKEEKIMKCYPILGSIVPSCVESDEYNPIYDPIWTVDGDEVVTTPSALMISEEGNENVEKYWVDLWSYNKGLTINRNHGNIFEVSEINDFIKNVILDKYQDYNLPENIKEHRPDPDGYENAKSRIRMSLYSPLDIHLYTQDYQRHTGPADKNHNEATPIEEEIPNSYLLKLGGRKYAGFPAGEKIHIKLEGYGEGTFTLKLEETVLTETGEETVSHTAFSNLPVSPDSEVFLDIPETGLQDLSKLKTDYDGNGEIDYAVAPVPNGEAEMPDIFPPWTELKLEGEEGENGWRVSSVKAELSASDNPGGEGLDKTFYSLDGEEFEEYLEPFEISKEDKTTLRYYSVDLAGNIEKGKSEIIKIDKTPPEARIEFDPRNQKIETIGFDDLSQTEVSEENSRSIVTDEAGHTLEVWFSKEKDQKKRAGKSIEKMSYDGKEKQIQKTGLDYKWRLDGEMGYNIFAAHLRSGEALLESHYRPKTEETAIMQKPRELDGGEEEEIGNRSILETLPGMVVPKLETDEGKIKIVY